MALWMFNEIRYLNEKLQKLLFVVIQKILITRILNVQILFILSFSIQN